MGNPNVAWANPDTRAQMMRRKGCDLLRLKGGCSHHAVFGQLHESRLIVGVHWIPEHNHARMCRGEKRCADCANKLRLTFHLYALAFVGIPRPFAAIVDLGTSIASTATTDGVDVSKVYKIERLEDRGPIKLKPLEYLKFDASEYQGWDILNDVERIFSGRMSPLREPSNESNGPEKEQNTPLEAASGAKRKGSKG